MDNNLLEGLTIALKVLHECVELSPALPSILLAWHSFFAILLEAFTSRYLSPMHLWLEPLLIF
jgi:hypothetical protein